MDGEDGALVLQHDAERFAVQLARRGVRDLLDLRHVAFGLWFCEHRPVGAQHFESVRAHVGGSVQRDHAAPVRERPAGDERDETESPDEPGEDVAELGRDLGVRRPRDDG